LKVKYASPEPDQQPFIPFLILLKLKTAGVKTLIRLSTGYTVTWREFNFTEIKNGPSRASPGRIFKSIYGVGNMGYVP
jgi:hypothetical protein